MLGEYFHSLDAKGRLFIPAKLRAQLGEQFVVTKGLDGCLFVYGMQHWARLEERIAALPLSGGRDLQRFFLSGASECSCDSQGRILIPQTLRTFAGLDKEAAVIGVSDRAEIWDAGRWNEYNHRLDGDVQSIAAAMEELSF